MADNSNQTLPSAGQTRVSTQTAITTAEGFQFKGNMTNKWDILPSNHPTVIRRLVRELNYRSAGFYFNGERFNQARFHKGNLEVRAAHNPWTVAGFESVFGDGNGGIITASRTRCGH